MIILKGELYCTCEYLLVVVIKNVMKRMVDNLEKLKFNVI